ncbi:MAG TPA: cell division protein FtsW, partial [Psychromonas hadalis]|nr:cell division protein FtsW [Psychromonas hadalis]
MKRFNFKFNFKPKNKINRYFKNQDELAHYDQGMLLIIFSLMSIGMVIVASASIPESLSLFNTPFHFLTLHLIYISLALIVISIVVNIKLDFWYQHQKILLIGSILILMSVLVIGTEVNGSHRWLRLGPLNVQPSEFAKLSIVLFV